MSTTENDKNVSETSESPASVIARYFDAVNEERTVVITTTSATGRKSRRVILPTVSVRKVAKDIAARLAAMSIEADPMAAIRTAVAAGRLEFVGAKRDRIRSCDSEFQVHDETRSSEVRSSAQVHPMKMPAHVSRRRQDDHENSLANGARLQNS